MTENATNANANTEIVITNETNAIAVYKVNYEQVKSYLTEELKKYDNLLVTEEYMSMAKKSRAELNAMKKELASRLSEVRNAQLKPYNDLKANYTDELERMIDEQLVKIDGAIKEIEKKKAEEKQKAITEYFNQANAQAQAQKELEVQVQENIATPEPEIVDIPSDDVESDLRGGENIPEENIPEEIETSQETQSALADDVKNNEDTQPKLERIEFWVEVTPEQRLLMRNFVLDNHIRCGKIVR